MTPNLIPSLPTLKEWKPAIEFFSQQNPKLWEHWQSPKFIPPPKGEGLYPNWDKIALCEMICACSTPITLRQSVQKHIAAHLPFDKPKQMNSAEADCMLHWKMQQGCPTIYIEPELGRALLSTDPPGDIPCEEIRWAYHTLRIILPKGLLVDKESGLDVIVIHGGLLQNGETLRCPKAFQNTFAHSEAQPIIEEQAMVWDTTLDSPEGIILHGFRPWNDKTLQETHLRAVSEASINSNEERTLMLGNQILINTILLLQAKPEYLQGQQTLRKANPNKNTKELRQGHLLGEFLKPRKSYPNQETSQKYGGTQSPQVRKGHWKMQPHGPKLSLRKLLWIHPYLTGREKP